MRTKALAALIFPPKFTYMTRKGKSHKEPKIGFIKGPLVTWKSESTEVCEGTWQEQGRLITVGLCWSQSLTL